MLGSQAQKTYPLLLTFLLLLPFNYGEIAAQETDASSKTEIVALSVPAFLTECENATFVCKFWPPEATIWWSFNGNNLAEDSRYVTITSEEDGVGLSSMSMPCVTTDDIGNYTCNVIRDANETISQTKRLDVHVPLEASSGEAQRVNTSSVVALNCTVKGYPITDVIWRKGEEQMDKDRVTTKNVNMTLVHSSLRFKKVTKKDNGTYTCASGNASTPVYLFVLSQPQISIDLVKAVGSGRIFLNWTVYDGNYPVNAYYLQFMRNGSASWTYNEENLSKDETRYVLKNLKPNTEYKIKLQASNKLGHGPDEVSKEWVQTLSKDPVYVPEILVKGVTWNSITIGWTSPPAEITDHVHYYELVMHHNKTKMQTVSPQKNSYQSANLYLFEDLNAATTYDFKVKACSEYTRVCGDWSNEVNGTTLDGVSGPPRNVTVSCKFDNISRNSFVYITWSPPESSNGKITRYNVALEGIAKFKNERGIVETKTWGPKVKSVNQDSENARFDMVLPNTNYTVRLSGVTRSRMSGLEAVVQCNMPPTIPDKEKLSRFNWGKVEEQGRPMFKLTMPRISERNGPICCYRVVMIRMAPQSNVADLPAPEEIVLFSYDEVHRSSLGGAYIAELFQSDTLNNEVFLGDGITNNADQNQCGMCFRVRPERNLSTPAPVEEKVNNANGTLVLSELPSTRNMYEERLELVSDLYMAHVQDGLLNIDSNYTGFVQVIVFGPDNSLLKAYSSYFVPLKAGQAVEIADQTGQMLSVVLQVLLALIFVVFIVLLALCLLQRYTKQVAEAQGVEMTLRNSFRHILCNKGYTEVELSVVCGRRLCQSLRGARHVPVSTSPPDMAPILRADMAAAYADRHRDSDYGFQQEFELLPDRFHDRTTRASEARENMYKNRYPDIKAYDQTRVKLSQVDGIAGSDYINANFVMGYKERKKFICAQGPMENTVSDFWRMIWEQHLELILMLTNLEEYSKTKCAKYWPDEGEKSYGDISITHVKEKRYSDYCVRELKMARSVPDKEKEERSIIQYHFLVWKDFMAPEHPSGILKFIRRVNEVYSLEKGPILVHCSAGVGRSGTLVALDSMTQQIQEEGEVSVFNTVFDLRHQRNFLVQNLKQYIFIYRALVELAQYGDTEHKIAKLKSAVEKVKQRENGKDKCKLEEDFEKISRIPEETKPCSVASGDENRVKNKVDTVIPYDRNRVILTPIPGREHSTYINASFIEGYDNSESFIITQDPLEVTVADFWRMISEQCISTLVMLSDLGEGSKKCMRYWPDDEISHNHIKVKYIQSESCPYYTRREFSVTNCKTDETITVTQFQYNGWPTVEGEVPEVTRGLIELVDQTQAHQETQSGSGPITVHCNHGAERSSIFVALAILVQQIRTEKRVDIFTTARKLRTQRQGMLQAYAQYEFLHRALVNYIDLHHLADDDA